MVIQIRREEAEKVKHFHNNCVSHDAGKNAVKDWHGIKAAAKIKPG